MSDLWLALHSVTRWHTNPHLCRMGQTDADHTAGMLALGLTIWPDMSRDLMVAIIYHDAAESVVGDMPWGGKQDPALKAATDNAEFAVAQKNGWLQTIWGDDVARLKFLDRLEAYRFAKLHAPQIMDGNGWPRARQWLQLEADRLGAGIREYLQ